MIAVLHQKHLMIAHLCEPKYKTKPITWNKHNALIHVTKGSLSIMISSSQFRFATCREILMMIVGSFCAIIHGSAQPLMLLVFGLLTDTFIDYDIELNELRDPAKHCLNSTIQWRNLTAEENVELNMTRACGWEITLFLKTVKWILTALSLIYTLFINNDLSFFVRLLNIEYEMTNFAYYYIGIGCAVFVLGYIQVSHVYSNREWSQWAMTDPGHPILGQSSLS